MSFFQLTLELTHGIFAPLLPARPITLFFGGTVHTGRLYLVAFFSLCLLITPYLALANTTSVNGTCFQGTCGNPDVLQPGQEVSGPVTGIFTFADGDSFGFTGAYDNSEAAGGNSVSMSHEMAIMFLGNNGGPSVSNDLMDLQFAQGFHTNFQNGTFAAGMFGSTIGTFGSNSSIQQSGSIDGTPFVTSPMFPLPGSFNYSSGDIQVNNYNNDPLILTFDYQIDIGAGTMPGATIYLDETPEPGSVLLFSTALLGAVGGLRKKFHL